jgi:rhamnulokinase
MDTRYYLAVDIGASSGRHMLSHLENGKLVLEEIYRFPNGMTEKNGHKVWDVDRLFEEIITGMKKCLEIGKIPYSMGIDTWAVDFVLLDENDKMLGDAVAYRDDRTKDIDKAVYQFISETELYTRTGIQKQSFNTIYQLMAVKKQNQDIFAKAKTMLMIPDYFHFLFGITRQVPNPLRYAVPITLLIVERFCRFVTC